MPEIVKDRLSIIIPFVQEYPMINFTVQALYCELRDKVDFEIICIDNWCKEVATQISAKGLQQDAGSKYMDDIQKLHPSWLKVLKYDKKLSHWNAKNMGVAESSGEFLFFCDSHCIPSAGSIVSMYEYYKEHHHELNGTLHLPLSYMLDKPGNELIYKLVTDLEKGIVHYSFTSYKQYDRTKVIPVPCMSTCGMMMSKEIYGTLGGWPAELGIYGGGEHFINFTLATMGKTVNIFPTNPLFHYAAPRGYHWNYNDYHRNRDIATFMYGGIEMAEKYMMNVKGNKITLAGIYSDIINKCSKHREHVKKSQVIKIEDWVNKWKDKLILEE